MHPVVAALLATTSAVAAAWTDERLARETSSPKGMICCDPGGTAIALVDSRLSSRSLFRGLRDLSSQSPKIIFSAVVCSTP